jgi:hypothetical protein
MRPRLSSGHSRNGPQEFVSPGSANRLRAPTAAVGCPLLDTLDSGCKRERRECQLAIDLREPPRAGRMSRILTSDARDAIHRGDACYSDLALLH